MGIDVRVSRRRALARLAGAQSRNPSRGTGKCTSERSHFAHCTAGKPCFERPAETAHAVALDKPFDAVPVRDEPTDCPTVAAFRFGPNLHGLWKEAPCIEGDDIDIETMGEDCVGDRLIFDAEARGKHDAPADFSTRRHEPIGQIQLFILFGQSRYQRCRIESISILL